MSRVLTIMEVSQKQAYIFSSNKLADNMERSAEIALVTSSFYIEETVHNPALYCEKNNLVYAGGGHTILEFPDMEKAKAVTARVTRRILEDFPLLEMFAKSENYDEAKTPNQNVLDLTASLERKKAERLASFHQGTFGVESTDVNTGKPVLRSQSSAKVPENKEWLPAGYAYTSKFEELGGNDSNFIAVVHIDGNAMGKRVENLAKVKGMDSWISYKTKMRAFSEGIASDFNAAYEEMEKQVAESMKNEEIYESLGMKVRNREQLFPIRRVIAEGDDVCFVANGKIGIECAVEFLKALTKRRNAIDGEKYAACAGVALVHQKYPFYRAYELAEALCSNAKRFGAELSEDHTGKELSCIDWHIEYGEIQDSLELTRQMYETDDGNRLEMRPYLVVSSEKAAVEEPIRQYRNFRTLAKKISKDPDFYGRGLLKGLRPVLKQGETAANYYLTFHRAGDIARDAYQGIYKEIDFEKSKIGSREKLDHPIFVTTHDKCKRSTMFDAIEISDNFVLLGEDA